MFIETDELINLSSTRATGASESMIQQTHETVRERWPINGMQNKQTNPVAIDWNIYFHSHRLGYVDVHAGPSETIEFNQLLSPSRSLCFCPVFSPTYLYRVTRPATPVTSARLSIQVKCKEHTRIEK